MSDQKIATQAGLDDLNFALAQLSDNTAEHLNASLTKAHGINIEPGYVDGDGNDRTVYQDAAGVQVGTKMVRLVIDNTLYYAPANSTSQPGKELTTGIITDAESASAVNASIDAKSWITDFVTSEIEDAENITNDVIVPHTRLNHDEVHGNFTVVNQPGYNEIGTVVGSKQAQIVVGGRVYRIPIDPRIGGPDQPPRGVSIPPLLKWDIGSGASNTVNYTFTVNALGTAPLTYAWEYYENSAWNAITPNASPQNLNLPVQWGGTMSITWTSASSADFTINSVSPDDNTGWRTTYLRVTVTNSGGSTLSNILTVQARDRTGCWICSEVDAVKRLSDEEIKLLLHFKLYCLEHHKRLAGFYLRDCDDLTERMKAANIDWSIFVGFEMALLNLIRANQLEAAYIMYRDVVLSQFALYYPDCNKPSYRKAIKERDEDPNRIRELPEHPLSRSALFAQRPQEQ